MFLQKTISEGKKRNNKPNKNKTNKTQNLKNTQNQNKIGRKKSKATASRGGSKIKNEEKNLKKNKKTI